MAHPSMLAPEHLQSHFVQHVGSIRIIWGLATSPCFPRRGPALLPSSHQSTDPLLSNCFQDTWLEYTKSWLYMYVVEHQACIAVSAKH